MHLSGKLADWSVSDLLHIMQVTNKTGSLDISGERRGRIHFKDGSVTGAELFGAVGDTPVTNREDIADILYVLSTMDTGTFTVGSSDGPDGDGFAVADILGEVEDLRAIEDDVAKTGLLKANGIKLVGELERPITLDPEDWHVLVSLVQPFAFGFLEDRLGRGGAVRVIHTLQRLGIAEPIDADEDQWLDELAGGLTASEGSVFADESLAAAEDEDTAPDPGHDDTPEKPILEPVVGAHEEPRERVDVRGVSAPASTTLTDGIYDEIRRLRSKAAEK